MASPAAILDPAGWGTLDASDAWRAVDCVSDLHLQADDAATWEAFHRWLQHTDADAICLLGDVFEVWVGDDVLDNDDGDPAHRWLLVVCDALRKATRQRPVYLMHGNRDFLLGPRFFACTGVLPLLDPTLLRWGSAGWLLSHGDAWCLADTDYLRFRAQVREPAWQHAFLQRPLTERLALARTMRQQSHRHQQQLAANGQPWADVDTGIATQWLAATQAKTLVHGHTHCPRDHVLASGQHRLVLSDWDAQAQPPRGEVLRLLPQGQWQRQAVLA
jgi:UDP-2,3-diacylglucosamine hydrolase